MTPLQESHILIVDDNRDLAENYAEILELKGASVRVGSSLDEARALVTDDIDIGIVDVRLPDGLGYELLQFLKERCPHAEVLMVTGQGTLDDAARAVGSGVYAYVLKPVSPDALVADIERALRQVRSTRELRAKEEALRLAQRTESVARLVEEVAHDFNNLLTVIGAFAHTVDVDAGDPALVREHAAGIHQATRRGAALTRQLLAYSRRRASRPALLDPNHVIEDLASFWQHVLGVRIRMEVDLGPEVGDVVADVGQLEQVLMNLVINARDAMPTGGVLRIESRRRELDEAEGRALDLEPGAYTALAVVDDGAGMDEVTRARATTSFFTTKGDKGTGLGLATAKSIVAEHGGALHIESELGRGTRVEVLLPEVPASRDTLVGQPASRRVLLVEDDELLRLAARFHLVNGGFLVSDHRTPESALEAARADGPWHAVVADLPDRSGDRLVAAVRELHPDVAVVYMTGPDDVALVETGDVILQKPFDFEQLPRVIQRRLDGGSATQRPSVLLVEDDATARGALVALLEDDYDVIAVGNAAEALQVVRRQHRPFEVLLTDLSLPDMDGRELARAVRELHTSTRLVFISGHVDPELPEEAGFVTKPIDLDALLRALG
ncbi:MAG: response regulator [Sandaracinaceae bacterium]